MAAFRERIMPHFIRCRGALLFGVVLACGAAAPASAQLLTQQSLSSAITIPMAQTAIETCKANGFIVSVTIVGRAGEVLAQVRGDGAPPHTMENSQRKAYTARTFRTTSGEFAKRVANDPLRAAQHLSGIILLAGALPIKAGEEVIGAIGVSGAPGGDKDEVCAQAAIDKVSAQLK
ncbi:MAG: heme-binding protein [Variibacter sp.]|nr:heme-binding protein [Variibacter sp.]